MSPKLTDLLKGSIDHAAAATAMVARPLNACGGA